MASPVRAVRRAVGQVPRAVLAATLAFGLLLALWSTALPLGDAPDETAHADLVFHLATGVPYPRHDQRKFGIALEQLCLDMTAATRACPRKTDIVSATSIRRHTRANAPPKAARPNFNDDGGDKEIGPFNQMLQHPPLYYWAMSEVIRVERFVLPGTGLPPLDREFALLRLVNVVLVMPLPLLAWWACRRLGLGGDIGVIASLIPFAIPQLLHIGSVLNNDNLLTLLVGVLTVLLAGVVRGDASRRTALAVGIVTALALLTKAFALVLPVVVAAAYVVASWRARPRREPAIGLVIAGIVSAALGGWWYVRNLVRGDGIAPSTDEKRLNSSLRPRGFHADPALWLRKFGALFTDRFWGWFGWYTVRISIAVIIGATVILLTSMVLGVATIGRAPRAPGATPATPGRFTGRFTGPLVRLQPVGPVGRLDLGVLLLPTALFGMFVMARSWNLYSRTSQFSFIQGRYLFGTVVGMVLVAAVGLQWLAGRWAVVGTFGWVVLMQVEGLRRVLSGYWGDRGSGPVDQVRALVAWSAWPGEWLAVGGVVLLAAASWLAFEVARTTRRPLVAGPPSVGPPDVAGREPMVDLPEAPQVVTRVAP